MDNRKKILVVTPSFYSPGAEQLDRLGGFSQLTRLGYEVKVIAKLAEWHSTEFFSMTARDLGIQVIPISYKYSKRNLFSEILHPLLLDGAAFEYNDPEIKKTFEKEINNWRPEFLLLPDPLILSRGIFCRKKVMRQPIASRPCLSSLASMLPCGKAIGCSLLRRMRNRCTAGLEQGAYRRSP